MIAVNIIFLPIDSIKEWNNHYDANNHPTAHLNKEGQRVHDVHDRRIGIEARYRSEIMTDIKENVR